MYNYTNLTNSINLADFIGVINQSTNNLFGVLVIIGWFVIMLIVMVQNSQRDFWSSLASTAFTCAIIAVLFRVLGLINDLWQLIFIAAAIGGVISLFVSRNS